MPSYFTKQTYLLEKKSIEDVVLSGEATHSSTVIFCHGLGDERSGSWLSHFRKWSTQFPHVKFILPAAKKRRVSIMGSSTFDSESCQYAWFDIRKKILKNCSMLDGLEESRERIVSLVQEEIDNGIPADQIFLGGFSQGAALALYTALEWNRGCTPLGGVLVVGGYLPSIFHTKISSLAKQARYFHIHGGSDEVIPSLVPKVIKTYLRLKSIGYATRIVDDMGHMPNDEAIHLMTRFFRKECDTRRTRRFSSSLVPTSSFSFCCFYH